MDAPIFKILPRKTSDTTKNVQGEYRKCLPTSTESKEYSVDARFCTATDKMVIICFTALLPETKQQLMQFMQKVEESPYTYTESRKLMAPIFLPIRLSLLNEAFNKRMFQTKR